MYMYKPEFMYIVLCTCTKYNVHSRLYIFFVHFLRFVHFEKIIKYLVKDSTILLDIVHIVSTVHNPYNPSLFYT